MIKDSCIDKTSKAEERVLRKMRRTPNAGLFRRAVWACLGLLLFWVFVITLTYGLVIHGNRKRINNNTDDLSSVKDEFSEIQGCCANFESVKDELEECTPACLQVLNNSQDMMFCRGCWDADTNTPELVSGDCDVGDVYVVCGAGGTSIDGVQVWEFGNMLKCLNVSGTIRWVKISAEAGGSSGGPFLHTFSYPSSGDPGTNGLFAQVIGYYWIHGTFVYIQGRAQSGSMSTTEDVEFRVGTLPLPPTSLPSGHMEAYTIESETFITRGRDYASTVSPSSFSGNYFNFTLNGKAFETYDLLFELSYNTV